MKLKHFTWYAFILVISGIVLHFPAIAQTNESPHWEMSPILGVMLPQNVTGYHESLGLGGLRIGTGLETFRPELTMVGGNGSGSKYQAAWVSLKNTITSIELQGFKPYWLLGLHYTRYKRPDQDGTEFPFFQASGWHFGFGVELPISPSYALRHDYYFGLNPGRILLITLGFQVRFGGASEAGNQP
ncbi:MAG: hypothetical protein H6624_09790 [Bdellovibrionaceae bacterium]|nr:hypothetical protein [Bdellovibrionales bacterium]MCB9084628.1 hypothetical protein [Pseudobdellovibrionaceae bacterium]